MCGFIVVLARARAVALGEKPFLVSGGAEGNAFRQFAYDQVWALCDDEGPPT